MKMTNTGPGVWRKFVQCFTTYTGLEREAFAVTEDAWRRLGKDHGEITSDTFTYQKEGGKRPEKVQWWAMDAAAELELRLTDFANESTVFHPSQID